MLERYFQVEYKRCKKPLKEPPSRMVELICRPLGKYCHGHTCLKKKNGACRKVDALLQEPVRTRGDKKRQVERHSSLGPLGQRAADGFQRDKLWSLCLLFGGVWIFPRLLLCLQICKETEICATHSSYLRAECCIRAHDLYENNTIGGKSCGGGRNT